MEDNGTIKNLMVLIIDDDGADHFLFSELLSDVKDCDYTIIEARSGAEALTLYEKEVCDCVLLDFMIQDMTGIEFLEKLQKEKIPLLPTVLVSNHLNPVIVARAEELGVKTNLDKSILTPEFIHKAITKAIEDKKTA